ncbi:MULTISPECIES: hypothetical protein [unclassified Actinomyces]|uniref:hypothetical protein n=1 Tax=unclassified Actinomyces TaxID=2609248 RepID=UPI000D597C7E|nr:MULTISPECIES: hypothetical protein [unclassified Actinomyces]RAX19543.1 hypothetical protein DRB06_12635 [Actinomyces sp. Z5]RAX21008.1 hypothetical protein DRB07_12370 [Actinomyces sp. Z3]
MKVDYADLGLTKQVLARQGDEHLPAMKSFLTTWGRIDSAEMGGLFSVLVPLNNAVVLVGEEVLGLAAEAHSAAADSMNNTIDAYAKADEQAWDELAEIFRKMDVPPPPFNDPRESIPSLGDAARQSSGGGGGDPMLLDQSIQNRAALEEYKNDQMQRLQERNDVAYSSNRSVREEQDPQSYLGEPGTPTSEMENLRWSAGALLGGLDWVFEKLFRWSFLNDFVYKNIVGDWRYVDRASTAWSELDSALVAVGQNDSGVLPALAEWVGKGAVACNAFITALSVATTRLSYAAGYVSEIVGKVALAAKLAATGLGMLLKKLSYKLARVAAEAAVPVVGWAAVAVECAILISDILGMVRLSYSIVNAVYDAIEGIVTAKAKIVEVLYTTTNIAEAAIRGAAVRA